MANIKDVEDWKKAVTADDTLLGLDEWVQERAQTAHGIFEEPESCEQCQSGEPMNLLKVSVIKGGARGIKPVVESKDGVPAWICSECGFAHIQPDHGDDCQGEDDNGPVSRPRPPHGCLRLCGRI